MTDQRSDQAILGTADYVAPEQARDSGGVDVRADIYSLGATFYFLLAGRAPFADGTLNQKLLWHQMKAPPPLRRLRPDVSEAMAAVMARMMAKAPADRYQTPAEVAAALAPWTRSPSAPPPSDFPPPRPTIRAGRPWRTGLPSAGSTVVEQLSRAATTMGASTVPNPPPTALACAVPIAAPLAPSSLLSKASDRTAPAPSPQLPAANDWSRLFDDSQADKPTSPRRGGKRPRATVADLRKHWRTFAGGAAAVLLLIGGVCLVLALLPPAPKPGAPAPVPNVATPNRPRGPTHLQARMKGPDAIELTWDDPAGPSNGFRIDRASDPYFTKDLRSIRVGPVQSFTDAELKPGPTFYYRVRALRRVRRVERLQHRLAAAELRPGRLHDDRPGAQRRGHGGRQGAAPDRPESQRGPQRLLPAGGGRPRLPNEVSLPHRRGAQTADGFTFCIQGDDPTALGQGAGGLGYQGIPNSVAVKFDLWDNKGEGANSTGLFRNGEEPSNPGAIDLTPSGIDLHSGRVCDAVIDYKDGKLTLLITDGEDAKKKFTATFDVDVPKTVGGGKASMSALRAVRAVWERCRIFSRGAGNRPRKRIENGAARALNSGCPHVCLTESRVKKGAILVCTPV